MGKKKKDHVYRLEIEVISRKKRDLSEVLSLMDSCIGVGYNEAAATVDDDGGEDWESARDITKLLFYDFTGRYIGPIERKKRMAKTKKKPKKLLTATFSLKVDYDPHKTDPESLAVALDKLMETALSTPDIFEDYGDPQVGEFQPELVEGREQGPIVTGYEPLKPFGYWPAEYNDITTQEGWFLTNDSSGRVNIARVDDPEGWDNLDYTEPKFEDDTEAQSEILRKLMAGEGSKIHALAIYLQGCVIEQELDVDPPSAILPTELWKRKMAERKAAGTLGPDDMEGIEDDDKACDET